MLDALTRAISERFRPRRIILFGSRARGDARDDSDYDVFVECEGRVSERELYRVAKAALESNGRPPTLDLILSTPKRFDERCVDIGTLEYKVDREGVVLYASPLFAPSRVRERPPTPLPSIKEWLQESDKDFLVAEQLMRTTDPVWDRICFHFHESAEKTLKALVVTAGTPPPRTHDLSKLRVLCPESVRGAKKVVDAIGVLEGVWPHTRYPSKTAVTKSDAQRVRRAAGLIRAAVTTAI
jgi:predicted nucleotidyltransferase/HEPN domain-containing protein